MENFYTYLKHLFFVDTSKTEIQDFSQAVDTIINRYADLMRKENPNLMIDRLQSSGSMVEQTRIWERLTETSRHPDIEFDYLAVVQRPEGMSFERSCLGHMHVVSDTDVDTSERSGIDLSSFVLQFWKTFVTVVTNSCSCFETSQEQVKPFRFTVTVMRNKRGCEVCTETMKTGTLRFCFLRPDIQLYHFYPIEFEWFSKDKNLLAPKKINNYEIQKQALAILTIHADFLPAFEINIPNTTGNLILGQKTEHPCYLVPKHCKQHETCWRISYCLSEIEILQNTSQSHRDVYKLLKVFQSQFKTGLKSYHIKTALLHHISTCHKDTESRHACLQETLDFLVNGMANRKMPHTIEGLNLRDVFSEHSLYLYQAQLFYVVLSSAMKLQENPVCSIGKGEKKNILQAFVSENGNDLFTAAQRVANGDETYGELLAEIIRLGEWVSKKRAGEYKEFNDKTCVIL